MQSDAVKYSDLTEAELKAYRIDKKRFFKGTIAVCVVYGVFAALLLAVAFFDSRGRQILSEDLLPFVITFVVATILIIIFLVIQVATFKPKRLQQGVYDQDMCPDYWVLKETPWMDLNSNTVASDLDKELMKYRCEPDPAVFSYGNYWNNNALDKLPDGSNTNLVNVYGHKIAPDNAVLANGSYVATIPSAELSTKYKELATASQIMYSSNVPFSSSYSLSNLFCDKVYPALLANQDAQKYPNAPNTLRCQYTKLCGIPWSSVCPSEDK